MKMAGNRVKPYFKELIEEYVFDELSDDFLNRMNAGDLLSGVPLPIRADTAAQIYGGKGQLSMLDLTRACGIIIGADPDFPYTDAYKQFLQRTFREHTEEVLVNEAHAHFRNGKLKAAACLAAGALLFNENARDALYSYALFCREIYQTANEREEALSPEELERFIGSFKAETMECLETLTLRFPEFAFPYYYLGFAYLNMGLYTKAYLTWSDFLAKIKRNPLADEVQEECKEIEERMASLAGPMEIEEGTAAIASGRYHEGIEILSRYRDGVLSSWWPMHYYLGIAYACTGQAQEAVDAFKRALALSPSNLEVMDELISVYRALGDRENELKYTAKMEVVWKNHEAEERGE